VIVPGANACLSEKDIEAVLPTFQRSNLLLIQGEIPLELSLFAARKAKELGLRVMFNAAPVPPKLDLGVLKELQIDFLVANSVEAGQIVNLEVKDFEGAKRAALEIADYVPCVIVTLSSEGILAFENGDLLRANAFGVEVADTLGAGDAFVGVLGARIAEGFGLEESIPHALAAGALAVTRVGAYAPTRRELEEFLNLRRKEVNIIRVPVKN
jgi:ribokinase